MRATNIIMLASLSKGKTEEYRNLLKQWPQFEFKALDEIVWNARHLSDVENGSTYEENAFSKGRIGHLAAKVPTLCDDTGLEVDALGGAPGVRSHRYAIPRAGETQDMANVKKLLQELSHVTGEKRKARFVCVVNFFVEGLVLKATGIMEGTIAMTPKGEHGFGYDSIFIPSGSTKTFAEMTEEEKNAISHRAQALKKVMSEAFSLGVSFVRP